MAPRSLPSTLLIAAICLLVMVAAVATPADADLWGHVAFGRDIITSQTIAQPDVYSFTSDRAWINHEWLAEVVFAGTYLWAGATGLIFLKFSLIAALLFVVHRYLASLECPGTVRMALVTMTFVGTYWRTHTIRPQLFSVLFFSMLLVIIARAEQGRRRGLFVVPLLMAVWANVHGGWIVGLGTFLLWAAARVVVPRTERAERLWLTAVAGSAVAATLITPYGIQLWQFLLETVRLSRADIDDWAPVFAHPVLLGVPWMLTLAVALLGVWRVEWSRRWVSIGLVTMLAVASLSVSRLDAFFTIAVVVFLAPELIRLSRRMPVAMQTPAAGPMPAAQRIGATAITFVAITAMLVPAAQITTRYGSCLTIGGSWAPDEAASRFIQMNQLRGRMLTWFDWGEYALWQFGPQLKVSIDGRRETTYSDATVQAHRRFYAGDADALSYVSALSPDYIWLPQQLSVNSPLAEAGWTPVFSGPVSVVFARTGAGPFQQPGPAAAGLRCFPGP